MEKHLSPSISGVGLPISPAKAMARFGRCVVDGTSLHGLSGIQRAYPEHWHRILRAGLRKRPALGGDATVGEVLRAGMFGHLLAREAHQRHLRKRRAGAQRVAQAVGDWFRARGWREPPVRDLDEGWLRRFSDAYVQTARDQLCSELIRRDLALLRRAVRATQQWLRLEPRVKRRGPVATKRAGRRVERHATTPRELAWLLHVTTCSVLRLVFALPAACGLWESQILRLTPEDFDMGRKRLHVHGGRVRGRPGVIADRWVAMPPWLVEMVWQAFPGIGAMPPDVLLFPHRSDSTRHRSTFRRSLARACSKARTRHTTFGALRRMFALVARSNDGPRGLVRGSVGRGALRRRLERERKVVLRASEVIAGGWRVLMLPPGVEDGMRWHLPRKAPKGVSVLQAEVHGGHRRRRRGAAVRAVPAGCRPGGWVVEFARRTSRDEAVAPCLPVVVEPEAVSQRGVPEPEMARAEDGMQLVRADSLAVAGLLGLGIGVLGRGLWDEWQREGPEGT